MRSTRVLEISTSLHKIYAGPKVCFVCNSRSIHGIEIVGECSANIRHTIAELSRRTIAESVSHAFAEI